LYFLSSLPYKMCVIRRIPWLDIRGHAMLDLANEMHSSAVPGTCVQSAEYTMCLLLFTTSCRACLACAHSLLCSMTFLSHISMGPSLLKAKNYTFPIPHKASHQSLRNILVYLSFPALISKGYTDMTFIFYCIVGVPTLDTQCPLAHMHGQLHLVYSLPA